MLPLGIEHFRDGDARPLYRRSCDQGRLAADGLARVASRVTEVFTRCCQVMECGDRTLLDQWIARWSDLVAFEVLPVRTSVEARGWPTLGTGEHGGYRSAVA